MVPVHREEVLSLQHPPQILDAMDSPLSPMADKGHIYTLLEEKHGFTRAAENSKEDSW